MKFGLIGEKLGHSYSPWIHAQLMEEPYELKELSKEEVGPFLERREFQGINVTIPYKQTVIPYLDELDESAEAVGAVNTIVNRDGKLVGYNTDVEGFKEMLNIDGVTLEGKVVLILGNGGASKAVRAVVKKANPKRVVIAYRKPHPDCILTEDAYKQVADAQIIINATPVGMYPNVKEVPIDVSRFAHLEAVADVVYNPLRTQFILDGAACGAKVSTGLSMLIAQAICANEKFRNVQLDHSMILTLTRKLQVEKENIVLVGMPSSGKTTLASALTSHFDHRVIEVDEEIVKKAGMSIPDIFAMYGETAFRDLESEVCERLSLQTHQIISTGGGSVLRKENRDSLRRNGYVVYIDRPIEDLLVGGNRPLSTSKEALQKMFEVRDSLYHSASDCVIKNNRNIEDTIEEIVEVITVRGKL